MVALEADKRELDKYREIMASTDEVTGKMVTPSHPSSSQMDILVAFEDRLKLLEVSAGPIHKSTQKLTRIYNSKH